MADETFERLLRELVDWELEQSPVLATGLGVEGFDDRLPDHSAAGNERRAREERAWLERLESTPPEQLDAAQRLDRDLAIATFRGRVIYHDWSPWRRSPDQYLQPGLHGVFALFLHRLRPEPELTASAAARLRDVPRLVADGKANLDPQLASPILLTRAVGQANAAARYARELVPMEVEGEELRAALAAAGAIAGDAFDDFAAFLTELSPRATGTYAVGDAIYTRVLQERELLNQDAARLHEIGEAQYDELSGELAELSMQVDGSPEWIATVRDLNRDHPPDPEAMRVTYDDWTRRARQFLVEHELVTLPEGEACNVVPSPVFQRPVLAVASYSMPPAFTPSLLGHFFVPFPPDGTSESEIQQRLESNSNHEIPTVSVHEAYPGHHWHLVVAKACGRPIRSIYRSTYFVEGWALYAEKMMREAGFFVDARQALMHVKDRIFRAARIVVDTALHAGSMSVDEATDFMIDKVGMPEPTARAEVHRYCAWPAQASGYLTGSLAIERVRDRWRTERSGQLRPFHDAIAGLGSMPVALHERGLFENGLRRAVASEP